MRTLREVLSLSIQHCVTPCGRPQHEVEEWLAHALGLRRLDIYMQLDRPIDSIELSKIRPGIARMARGEPVAYIMEKAFLYGYEFYVTNKVLIPRPETETLIQEVLRVTASMPPGVLIDACTGSGCIGIILKHLLPEWQIIMTDISQEALSIARHNAMVHAVDVEIIHGNGLAPCIGRAASCIVSNPPYIATDVLQHIDPSVTQYEPLIALDGGESGLSIYRQLLSNVAQCIDSQACLLFEIGFDQKDLLLDMLKRHGCSRLWSCSDLYGNDRVVGGWLESRGPY